MKLQIEPCIQQHRDEETENDVDDLEKDNANLLFRIEQIHEGKQTQSLIADTNVESPNITMKGEYQIGDKIKPLDPTKVGSVVQYGKVKCSLRRKAIGQSLIYNQLYPFEGL
ncbi:Purple acid phosphatase 15 [Capsicum baccatum]|uniref:Purple acid phosphatase 15 n=1 Tax=Capsicum baccatum TaxID=33114 RepID=A0A2G2WVZ7_CAPBA|nr:Purple acid phosphatase 15 [Capsicum baccatum]